MKKIIIFSIAVITIFSACNRVDYIAKGENKFDLVFITTNKDAENYWAPLTALVDEYFGTVIIPLNSDPPLQSNVINLRPLRRGRLRHIGPCTFVPNSPQSGAKSVAFPAGRCGHRPLRYGSQCLS